jgi:hypothetical protein
MKKMLIIWLILAPAVCIAQTIQTDKIDDFNGTRIIETSSNKFEVNTSRSLAVQTACYVIKKDGVIDTSMNLHFFFQTRSVTACRSDSKVYLKLSNDEVLQLPYDGDIEVFSSNVIAYIYSTLSDSDIKKLFANKISKIRISTSSDVLDYDVADNSSNLINAQIKLVMDKLHSTLIK